MDQKNNLLGVTQNEIDDMLPAYYEDIDELKKSVNKLPSKTLENKGFDLDNLPLKIPF